MVFLYMSLQNSDEQDLLSRWNCQQIGLALLKIAQICFFNEQLHCTFAEATRSFGFKYANNFFWRSSSCIDRSVLEINFSTTYHFCGCVLHYFSGKHI